MTRTLALAAAFAVLSTSTALAADGTCRLAGVLGYYDPRPPECPERRGVAAERTATGIILSVPGGTWRWRQAPRRGAIVYHLAETAPDPGEGVTGTMVGAAGHGAIGGTIYSHACGDGFVALAPLRGSCKAAAPTHQAPAGEARLPASGRSSGGTVRAAPSSGATRIAHLPDGQPLVILEAAGRLMNGLPWYRVRWPGGEGYQWGGLLCADTAPGRLARCRN